MNSLQQTVRMRFHGPERSLERYRNHDLTGQ
jgi:hypothetical protein